MADDGIGKGGEGGGFGGFGFGKGSLSTSLNAFGGAANDLFSAEAYKYKEKGALIEKGMYTEAAGFARENEQFTELSTNIKEMQQQRGLEQVQGATDAAVSGAGFEASGSALDILRDSAQQGALAKQVLGFQGKITEAGYEQQAKALDSQAAAAQVAADAAKTAQEGSYIGAAIKGVTAVASLFGV